VVWNTSLAVIPVAAAYAMYWLAHRKSRALANIGIIILGLIWLAFLPNTCYLLTEWRHFLWRVGYSGLYAEWRADASSALELMIYTLFYMVFSGIGVLTLALAIRPIHRLARERGAVMWVWGVPLFLLLSIGVYLGLILRFNSWELLSRTGEIWASALEVARRPALTFFVVSFAGFLWLVYLATDIWIDGLLARLRSRR